MAIVRYNPYADLEPFPGMRAFQDTMNRLFAEPAANGRPWVPPVDILETEHELVVKADVPDLKFEDIDVRMENGPLTIRGERKFEKSVNEESYLRVERAYGSFTRTFSLPNTVNAEGINASYSNGVLTVHMPKREESKPKQVKINVSTNGK